MVNAALLENALTFIEIRKIQVELIYIGCLRLRLVVNIALVLIDSPLSNVSRKTNIFTRIIIVAVVKEIFDYGTMQSS